MTVDGLPVAAGPDASWKTVYNYDRFGRLELLHDEWAHGTEAFIYGYHSTTGLLNQIETPWQQAGQPGHLRETRSYDSFGRLKSRQTIGSDGTAKMGVQGITYDRLDRRNGLTLFGGTLYASQEQTRAYDYDTFGQLKQQSTDAEIDQEFVYDPIGNRLGWWQGDPVDPETALIGYVPNLLNQYNEIQTGGGTDQPIHDLDGNLEVSGQWTYQWNTENQLVEAKIPGDKKLRFVYDGLGRRTSKEVREWDADSNAYLPISITVFTYDGWNLIAEVEYNSTFIIQNSTFYTWGLDLSGTMQGAGGVGGLLAVTHQNGSTYLPSYDFNGNIMGYFDTSTESPVAEFEYGPFGELIRATGSHVDQFNFRFSTKYEDAETGLLYYGYRYYNPEIGRWLSRDPIEEQGGLNLYGFVGNDPLGYIDYIGLSIFSGIKKTAGGAAQTIASLYALKAGVGLSLTGKGAIIGVPLAGIGFYGMQDGVAKMVLGVGEVGNAIFTKKEIDLPSGLTDAFVTEFTEKLEASPEMREAIQVAFNELSDLITPDLSKIKAPRNMKKLHEALTKIQDLMDKLDKLDKHLKSDC